MDLKLMLAHTDAIRRLMHLLCQSQYTPAQLEAQFSRDTPVQALLNCMEDGFCSIQENIFRCTKSIWNNYSKSSTFTRRCRNNRQNRTSPTFSPHSAKMSSRMRCWGQKQLFLRVLSPETAIPFTCSTPHWAEKVMGS